MFSHFCNQCYMLEEFFSMVIPISSKCFLELFQIFWDHPRQFILLLASWHSSLHLQSSYIANIPQAPRGTETNHTITLVNIISNYITNSQTTGMCILHSDMYINSFRCTPSIGKIYRILLKRILDFHRNRKVNMHQD